MIISMGTHEVYLLVLCTAVAFVLWQIIKTVQDNDAQKPLRKECGRCGRLITRCECEKPIL